jgi:hypothetical protein
VIVYVVGVDDASPVLALNAGVACIAMLDLLAAQFDELGIDPVFPELLEHYFERDVRVPMLPRATVECNYLHPCHLRSLRFIGMRI